MINIPNLVPIKFFKEETIDYINTFPSSSNTLNVIEPTSTGQFVVKFPATRIFSYQIWSDEVPTVEAVTDNEIVVDAVVTEISDNLYKITQVFNYLGLTKITITSGSDVLVGYVDVLLNLQPPKGMSSAEISFSNFENGFDYLFDDEYFNFFAILDNMQMAVESVKEEYDNDDSKPTLLRARPKNGINLKFTCDEYWTTFLNSVFSCSRIRVNGLGYVGQQEVEVSQKDENISEYTVEVTLFTNREFDVDYSPISGDLVGVGGEEGDYIVGVGGHIDII